MAITIHPELQSLIPPLTTEEYTQLEANIRADGCHDPLIVWQEEQTLLDGHNRYAICEQHGLDYRIQELSLPGLDAAKEWIIANQLGRRNLTPEQMSYYRGKQYAMQKRQGQRTDLTSDHNEQKSQTTAAQLARQHQVSDATIRRDAAYAHAVDTLAEVVGPEARQALLARETQVPQHEVKQLADIAQVDPILAQKVLVDVQRAKTPKAAKRMVQTAVEVIQEAIATAGSGNLAEAGIPQATLDRLSPTSAPPSDGLAARFQQALRSLEVLKTCLTMVSIPEALDSHTEACIDLGKAYRQVERLTMEHPAVCNALSGPLPVPPKTVPRQQTSTRREDGTLTRAVWLMVHKLQPCTNAAVAKALGEQRNVVHQALTALVKQRKLSKEGLTYRMIQSPSPRETPAPQGPSKPRKPGSLRKAVE
jgi:hypothetical protein